MRILLTIAAALLLSSCASTHRRKSVMDVAESRCNKVMDNGEPRWKGYGSFAECVKITAEAVSAKRDREQRRDAAEEKAAAEQERQGTKCVSKRNALGEVVTECAP